MFFRSYNKKEQPLSGCSFLLHRCVVYDDIFTGQITCVLDFGAIYIHLCEKRAVSKIFHGGDVFVVVHVDHIQVFKTAQR